LTTAFELTNYLGVQMHKIENTTSNRSKSAYSKPLITVLSTDAGTQGMGLTPILMLQKVNIGSESTINFRSVS
jgi:hypothetical protein